MGAMVFIVLATALILLFTNKYRSTFCAGHLPVDLDAETEQELIDQQMGLGQGVRVDPVASLGRGQMAAKGVEMPGFTSVARSRDVLEGEMAVFDVGGQRVAVANVEGSFHAFGDICTHRHCSLADGELDGKTVTCPCHGSQFDVTTGDVLNPPATEPVPLFPLQIEGDEIQVDV